MNFKRTMNSAALFQFQLFVSLSNLQFDSFVLLFKFSVPGCCFYWKKKLLKKTIVYYPLSYKQLVNILGLLAAKEPDIFPVELTEPKIKDIKTNEN